MSSVVLFFCVYGDFHIEFSSIKHHVFSYGACKDMSEKRCSRLLVYIRGFDNDLHLSGGREGVKAM